MDLLSVQWMGLLWSAMLLVLLLLLVVAAKLIAAGVTNGVDEALIRERLRNVGA